MLCRLVVEDFENWNRGRPLESYKTSYGEGDLVEWRFYVSEDLDMGITRNWWYGFPNQRFLCFLNIQLHNLKKEKVK